MNFIDVIFHLLKVRGYAVAFNFLHYKDWVLLIDADVILNEKFGEFIKNNISNFNINFIYGCIRLVIEKYSDFILYENGIIKINELEIGKDNWINGFFQLFNLEKLKNKEFWEIYPQSKGCIDDDIIFLLKFGNNYIKDGKWIYDKNYQKMIDLSVIHLGKIGVNHDRRVSKKFELHE